MGIVGVQLPEAVRRKPAPACTAATGWFRSAHRHLRCSTLSRAWSVC